ncbi:hypothetical protein HU200_033897 [Digitaria exilis]|uniref:non-specific serine/threonine protein kinase n=1 Tax=Digitaria exilis TaxID=1010633 RepID=A0A835BKJ6_9POAL|nr:hypothetical protein HU200_033897 [Digitaria exilis]
MASLAVLLLLARFSSSIAVSPNSYISRTGEQQVVIATVAPAFVPDIDGQTTALPFLTSPSGSYAAYLRRALAGGDLAGYACYVQVQQATGGSVWESDCTPVGRADACDLAFSAVGLELFAGGHSLWDTGVADTDDPGTLSLDDAGDIKIVTKEGVTVWTASEEPWTGQQCGAGAPLPVSSSSSAPSMDAGVLPPPSASGEKLVTPPLSSATTLAGAGSTDDFSSGASAPDVTLPEPDLPAQPPIVTAPEQPLAPPPADASPDVPDFPLLPPPPAFTSPDTTPDQPLQVPAPPPADVSPDQPLYTSPPPAPAATTFGPDTSLPPFGVPFASPPMGGDSSIPGAQGGVPFSGPSPAGIPNPHGPPLPDALAPSVHGAGQGHPFGHGQQQQQQVLNGEGQPLEESSGRWSGGERGRVAACMALFSLMALGFGF